MQSTRKTVREIGDHLPGGYEIFDVKAGGMGVVYLVQDSDLPFPFAVKTFQDQYLTAPTAVKRFLRECKTWIRLGRHPHVVQAQWVDTMDRRPHLFLEYVDGGSLETEMAGGTMSIARILDVSLQVCEGMIHAQKTMQIVHRDIKPSNLLVTRDGVVKIADFGLVSVPGLRADSAGMPGRAPTAQAHGNLTTTDVGIGGTPQYMAPEQWSGTAGFRSDIYSFGVVLYEMLCGERPFELDQGEPPYMLHAKQLMDTPPNPRDVRPDVPPKLAEAILTCLQREPESRYGDFLQLSGVLLDVHAGAMGREWHPPPSQSLPRARGSELSWAIVEGSSFASLGEHAAALESFDHALLLDPTNQKAQRLKGMSCCALGRHAEAMRCFLICLGRDPDDGKVRDSATYCLNAMGRHAPALHHALRATKLDPQSSSPWNNMGVALAGLGRVEDALSAFDTALEIDPDNPEVWNNKGHLLGREGPIEEALSCLARAIGLDPAYVQPYHNSGQILYTAGQTREALTMYERADALSPGNCHVARIIDALRQELEVSED